METDLHDLIKSE